MTITAKFEGKCAECDGEIAVGARVEWERGQPARHAKCPETPKRVAQGDGYGKSWSASRPGHCGACRKAISAGQAVRYHYIGSDKTLEHLDCAAAPAATPAPTSRQVSGQRRNQRPGFCHQCGCHVPAGAGALYYCDGDANGCAEHFDGGWAVLCGAHS